MTPPLFALFATCLLSATVDIEGFQSPSSSHFLSVAVGEDITLECFYEETVSLMFYWYKQHLGQKPQEVSKFYKHDHRGSLSGKFKNDTRFELQTSTSENHLKISNVQISDSATYYCIRGHSYMYEFVKSTIIHVKGLDSGQASVHQSVSVSIQLGGSVTLSCTVHTGTCDGEHSVYWFRDSGEPHSGLIYTNGGQTDHCEQDQDEQTHSCVYELPMKSLKSSHAGTYYCAVASCGNIVFGNGTRLDFEDSSILVYFLTGALAFTTILVVYLAYKTYTMYRSNSCQCTDPGVRPSASATAHAEGDNGESNLHYAVLRKHKANRSTRQRDDTATECVYSSVRQ